MVGLEFCEYAGFQNVPVVLSIGGVLGEVQVRGSYIQWQLRLAAAAVWAENKQTVGPQPAQLGRRQVAAFLPQTNLNPKLSLASRIVLLKIPRLIAGSFTRHLGHFRREDLQP